MLSKKFKDRNYRKIFLKLEILKKIYKIVKINLLNNIKYKNKKMYIQHKLIFLTSLINNISKTQIKNRCILSNRNKSILRNYSISRIKLRELINFGILPGYKKAAW